MDIVDHVMFKGEKIDYPYRCDPRDNEVKCQLYYNVTQPKANQPAEQDYFETECKCSLDGDTGYCGTILGTKHYQEEISKISSLFQSSNCHTNDRDNFAALNDICSIAKESEWEAAI